MSTTVSKADHPASSIHAGLTLLCEDPRRGVAPTLATMMNADTHTSSEAARTLGESLLSIINLANSESAKAAFGIDRFPIPSSLADKAQQRLEWLILATLVPVLTIPQSDKYRDLVFNALLAIRYALAYSEEGFLFGTTSWPTQRAKGFDNAVLGILNDICVFLKSKTLSFPTSCHIKMNAFKGGPTVEADPTWVTLHFHALDSTITVIRCLLGILCPENDSSGGLVDLLDDDQQVHQMDHILTVLDIFLPNGVIAKKEWKGDRPLAADSTSVTQLYQECCQCILKTIPLRSAGCSLYPSLAKSLMIILYHHVMTVEDRCKDWSSSISRPPLSKVKVEGVSSSTKDPGTTAMSVRECRKEIHSIGALEDVLAKSLTLTMESCFSLFPDTVELREVLYLVVDLLLSKQLLLLSHDSSGIHVQRLLLLLATRFVPSGAFRDPMNAIDYILSHYGHLELDLVAQFIQACLEHWRTMDECDESNDDMPSTTAGPSSIIQGNVSMGSSSKRSMDDAENERIYTGKTDPKAKRARRESPISSSLLLESQACSSIVTSSQFSQRGAKNVPPVTKRERSPSKQLLSMLKKRFSIQTMSYTASQGARGIQPPLKIEELQASVVIVHVWTTFILGKEPSEIRQEVEQLANLIEFAGRHYILWALSPGMQNPSLNQSYLEATYPMILDLITPLSLVRQSDHLNALLICLASGPWFPDLARVELWQRSEDAMDLDSVGGLQQLVNGIHAIAEGTEILSRLRDNPDILQSCEKFREEKSKALKIMATFAQCSRLDVWRREAILHTLKDLEHGTNITDFETSDALKIASLEALTVLSSHCPDITWTIETALRYLQLDEESEVVKRTLGRCIGMIACGYSSVHLNTDPKYFYDTSSLLYVTRWTCPECDKPPRVTSHAEQDKPKSHGKLKLGFLDPFKRLIPNCISSESRLALLQGLSRAFCHLDLENVDLGAMDFGKFVLLQLHDSNSAIRIAAGEIIERIAKMAAPTLLDDPLGNSSFDNCLASIYGTITKASSRKNLGAMLSLCRRIMRHLPEDHATYNDVLLAVIDQLFSEHNVTKAGFILDELAAIAREKGFTNYRLLQPHMEIVNALVINMLSSNQDRWLESFYHWTGHSQMRYFEQNIQDLIPKMILCQQRSLIEKAAMVLKEKVGEICINNVDHILATVYMSRNEELIKPCIELLRDLIFQSESDSGTRTEALGIAELTTLSTESLLCYIIVELGQDDQSKREKARKVIDIIEGYARDRTKEGKSKKPSLAAFMMRNILAIMSKVNAAFSDTQKRVTLRTKVKYLRCLVPLVKMLDPIQRSVLSQIFTPLNIALSVRGLRPHALQALDGIIRSVKTSQLDTILSHIVHTLVKQYTHSNHTERSTELEILEFLIFNQELTAVLPDVEDLPDLPEFEAMNNVLRAAKSQGTLEQQLQRLIERIGNENSELAEQAVIELRKLLLTNNDWLLSMATTKEKNAPPVLCDLIRSLFSGISRFRGLDGPVPRRSIECLGIIGAIDPAKLSEMRLIPAPPVHTNFSDLEEAKDFVCRLIEVQLVGKTRSIGDIRSEDRWAITLQSLLSFCGITKEVLGAGAEKSTPSRSTASTQPVRSAEDRWQAFPRHVQEVLELLIDARYAEKTSPQDYPYPIYLHSKTFKEWLTAWTQVLIGKVTSPYAKEIFQACKNVVPYDINTCLYILPHLVLNVLIEGSEKDRKEIVGEMAAILGDTLNWKNRKDDGAEQSIGMQKQISSELNQLGSQTVFVLFDHISKWIQITKAASTKSASSRSYASVNEPSQATARVLEMTLSGVQAHLTSISHDVIAMASFRFKGYARSLLHYEQYIRESRTQGSSEQALQAMYEKHQEIYAHMEEPDGMDGISGLITSGTLNQNLLQCESAGRWSEALAYYELGMREKPSEFDNYAGLYKCHDNLGQFRTLLSCVEGDIKTHPEWEQQLTDWRIASARKVQDWESLVIALSRSTHPSFEVGLGQLMLDMRDNRVEDFGKHLQQVRCMLIPPLAATSMESYSRSYESMVQLHLLHELEVAFRSWNTGITAGDTLGSQIAIAAQGTDSYVDRVRAYQPILDKRFESMAPSFKVREQVARLRRLAFYDVRIPHIISEEDLTYLKESCGKLWLESAKSARKAGNSQVSYSALLHAEEFMERSSSIERAKWEFLHQNERQAIKTIDSALKRTLASQSASSLGISSRISSTPVTGRLRQTSSAARRLVILQPELNRTQDRVIDKSKMGFIRAKAHLLRTQWMDRSSLVSPSDIIEGYRQATVECERWEKSYYLAGQYYLKLYDVSKRSKHRPPNYSYLTGVCRHYAKALTLGPKYLYQALPRLLTFWLDLGQLALAGTSPASAEFQQVNSIMMNLAGILPEYMFLSAFPQIISRICHKNASAFEVLQHIIVNVVLAFPDQAIWQMVSVSRSVVPERKRVCNMILDTIHLRPTIGQAITERIKEALDLCDNLITLCMAPVPDKVDRLSLQKHFPKVYPQLRQHYNVAIPCQQSLWPSIPGSSATMASHQPFRPNLPKIDRFMDEVEVMSSLQKPRKITVAGSDGVLYTFLCKPKDDLRKDAKVMEFNGLVNMLLRKDRETSKRNLYIRTYSVVPLNEECGIIEWVHNTLPFRHVVYRQYKANNISTPQIIDIKRVLDHEDHVRLFAKELVPKFPPYFYRWFFDISPEPSAWFETRLRYTRTTAVMSMVGHIMGLGDRHGENLLFDERNGDLVHVDFNCLFEQGKSFPKPERVPFRLTHNMIDAMGLSGYDGVYRISCEKTLQVFRDNLESLASVLEGFIHDPLVEWSKSKRKSQQIQQEAIRVAAAGLIDQEGDEAVPGAADEARARLRSRAEAKAAAAAAAAAEVADAQQNEKAQAILLQIKRKLSGTDNSNPYVQPAYALSVRGQVEELIQAATSSENLAKMYIGWSAYL